MTMEKDKKNGFVFYESWYDGAKELNPKHRGIFLEAIIKYGLYGEETNLSGVDNALFSAIKPTIKFNRKQRANAIKGGANQGNNNARKTTQTQAKRKPNSAIYLDDIDRDIDREEDKEVGSSSFIDEFFEIENEILGRLDKIELSPAQATMLNNKYTEKGAEIFREFWEKVKESDWLQKQDISLMLNEKVFENVLNGVYRNYAQNQNSRRDMIGTHFVSD